MTVCVLHVCVCVCVPFVYMQRLSEADLEQSWQNLTDYCKDLNTMSAVNSEMPVIANLLYQAAVYSGGYRHFLPVRSVGSKAHPYIRIFERSGSGDLCDC